MAALDFRGPPMNAFHLPHRKPVQHDPNSTSQSPTKTYNNTIIRPDFEYSITSGQGSHHIRTITTTSTTTASSLPHSFASNTQHSPSTHPSQHNSSTFQSANVSSHHNSRPATFQPARIQPRSSAHSTYSVPYSNSQSLPTRTLSNVSSKISRTSSIRSGASLASSTESYVSLMRKQKATVWCDRSQLEDPRLLAQQKAAKLRATREIEGPVIEGRVSTSSSGVRSKIRHHVIPKVSSISGGNAHMIGGGGVPMRLSANEVSDEDTRTDSIGTRHESIPKQQFLSVDTTAAAYQPGSANPSVTHRHQSRASGFSASDMIPSTANSHASTHTRNTSYHSQFATQSPNSAPLNSATTMSTIASTVPDQLLSPVDYTSELENSFGKVEGMTGPSASKATERRTDEELKRRGSVDERCNTMGFIGGGRLFVANPDVSD